MSDVERGAELRRLRETAGLTGAQVGAEFGISKSAVSEWETGKSRPDVHKLAKLDDLYAAGGQVFALFGLTRPDEVAQLRRQVAQLTLDLQSLGATVAQLGGEVRQLRAQLARPAGDTQ